jgi:hypothetical protein
LGFIDVSHPIKRNVGHQEEKAIPLFLVTFEIPSELMISRRGIKLRHSRRGAPQIGLKAAAIPG